MRIEATYTTGAVVKDKWEYEPNLRAEIKQRLADELAMKMRFNDLIDFVLATAENGDTVITASIEASSTGDEQRANRRREASERGGGHLVTRLSQRITDLLADARKTFWKSDDEPEPVKD